MADIPPEFDDADLDWPDDGAARVGARVIEMCDRLRPMHAIAPGAAAKWCLEIDDMRFEVTVRVAGGDA